MGWSTTKAIIGQRLLPGVLDRYLARKAWEAQTTTTDLPPGHPLRHRRDNVDTPIAGDRDAHGPFGALARTFSTQVWVSRHRSWLALAAVVLAARWLRRAARWPPGLVR